LYFDPFKIVKFIEITCIATFAFAIIIASGPVAFAVKNSTFAVAFVSTASFAEAFAAVLTFGRNFACLASASSLGSLAIVVLALYLEVFEDTASAIAAEQIVMASMA
jgi:hypothetical protein